MVDLGIEGFGPGESIGHGASSTVFVATRLAIGDRVAVKILRHALDSETHRRQFDREARALAELADCEGVVAILDHGITQRHSEPYLVMPLLDRSTRSVVEAGGTSWQRAVGWVQVAARAVHAAHERGIFHRDIKPDNLLLTAADDVFVADFGIAVLSDSSISHSQHRRYTPGYAPPEAFDHATATAARDVYALGATLVALIIGRRPFEGPAGEHVSAEYRRVRENELADFVDLGIPAPIATVINRAMAKLPADRHATAADLADELEAAADQADRAAGTGRAVAEAIGVDDPAPLQDEVHTSGDLNALDPIDDPDLAATLLGSDGTQADVSIGPQGPDADLDRVVVAGAADSRAVDAGNHDDAGFKVEADRGGPAKQLPVGLERQAPATGFSTDIDEPRDQGGTIKVLGALAAIAIAGVGLFLVTDLGIGGPERDTPAPAQTSAPAPAQTPAQTQIQTSIPAQTAGPVDSASPNPETPTGTAVSNRANAGRDLMVEQGERGLWPGCSAPCDKIVVAVSGFEPDTVYPIHIDGALGDDWCPDSVATLTTDASGSARAEIDCWYGFWNTFLTATVDETEHRVLWRE